MRALRTALLLMLSGGSALGISGCVFGDELAPGCQSDQDCTGDFVCRAGACFGNTTPLGPAPTLDGKGGASGAAGASGGGMAEGHGGGGSGMGGAGSAGDASSGSGAS